MPRLTAAANEFVKGDSELEKRADRIVRELASVDAAMGQLIEALERDGVEAVQERLMARQSERRQPKHDLLTPRDAVAS